MSIDTTALDELRDLIGGDTADLHELIADFLEEGPALVASIQAAIASEDTNALRIAAHTLKSNAHDMGARALSGLCAEIETAAKADKPGDAAAQKAELGKASDAAFAELKAILAA